MAVAPGYADCESEPFERRAVTVHRERLGQPVQATTREAVALAAAATVGVAVYLPSDEYRSRTSAQRLREVESAECLEHV